MIRRRFNYKKFIIFVVVVLLVIGGIIFGVTKTVSYFNYKKTYEYKLIELGYSKTESDILEKKLTNKQLDDILSVKYNKNIIDFLEEKYFLYKNLDKYLSYKLENKKEKNSDIITIINTESNVEWIDEEKETDTSKGSLMLVNRLYGLTAEYEPEDIVKIDVGYAYSGNKISESIMPDIMELINAGKEAGYKFVVSSGYRSYAEQNELYENYKESYGIGEADKIVARPGHSEYQTGISFDLQPYNKVFKDGSEYESEEYKWLEEHAHEYGFIIRFKSEKNDITKFNSSAWRLRFVGVDAAKIMHDENLCFEEYYSYYVK